MIDDHYVAVACHEANRAYCAGLGDHSQLPWDLAPQWQRDSVIDGVRFLRADPSRGPRESHQRWFAHKFERGWRYGEEKDPQRKTHPCMLPYERLPEHQRLKDELFCAIVRTLS